MALEELKLTPGTWIAADCGSMPSENNCQLVIMAPQAQQDDLLDAATMHAVDKHGHEDNEELRNTTTSMLQVIEVT